MTVDLALLAGQGFALAAFMLVAVAAGVVLARFFLDASRAGTVERRVTPDKPGSGEPPP